MSVVRATSAKSQSYGWLAKDCAVQVPRCMKPTKLISPGTFEFTTFEPEAKLYIVQLRHLDAKVHPRVRVSLAGCPMLKLECFSLGILAILEVYGVPWLVQLICACRYNLTTAIAFYIDAQAGR